MAYPVVFPFKTRVINAGTSSTVAPAICVVPVPARGKLLGGFITTNGLVGNTVSGGGIFDGLFYSGATSTAVPAAIAGCTGIAAATSTAIQSFVIPPPSPAQYLFAGDVLSVQASSTPGYAVSLVIQEF